MQQVNFVVFGVAIGCPALGWRAALAQGLGATAIPALKGVTALALIADGLFSQDPAKGFPPGAPPGVSTLHGTIHVLGAFVAVLSLAAACVVFAARFAREPRWRAWAPFALAAGVLTIVFIAAFGATLGRGPAGLFERLMSGTESIFNTLVVSRLLLGTGLVSTTG